MKTVFLGEGGYIGSNVSIGMGTDEHSSSNVDAYNNNYFGNVRDGQGVDAWMEIWDYTSGCSFRAFVGGKGDQKSLFAFFDSSVIGRDLKQGLMALIELADTVFAISQIIICLDRTMPDSESKSFLKSLRWVGFELITLDMWANRLDVISDKWLFLGMEV